MYNWLNKSYGFSLHSVALYDIVIDKMNGCGHIETAHYECLPKKKGDALLATEGLIKKLSA